MKGRKKISDASKRLRGTDQPCRMDGAVVPVNPVAALPKAKGLKGTAKKLYQLVGTELASKGLIDAANIDLLLAYCREMALYQTYEDAYEMLESQVERIIIHHPLQGCSWCFYCLPRL